MDAVESPVRARQSSDLLEQASGPLEDAVTPAGSEDDRARFSRWLSRALQVERAAVNRLLEAKHVALAKQLEQGSWRGPDTLERSAPLGALRKIAPSCAPALPGSVAGSAEAPGEETHYHEPVAPSDAAPSLWPNAVIPDLAWDPAKPQRRSGSLSLVPSQRTASLQSPAEGVSSATAADAVPRQHASASDVPRRTSVLSGRLANRMATTVFRKREEQSSRLGRLVTSTGFEAAGATAVVLLAFCMALESQYTGLELGFQLEYGTYSQPAVRVWPWAVSVLEMTNWALGIAFCLELFLKFMGLGVLGTFKEAWSIVDALISLMWIAEVAHLRLMHSDALLLRVIRILRLVRFIRLVKTFRFLDSLYLIYTALAGSVTALGWSTVILFLLQVLVAFILTETLNLVYFNDISYDEAGRREVFEYFGTFTRAVVSTFEMTLANWPIPCRLLIENVSEWFAVLCLVHKLTVGFAVVGIINGVFIQETFKCAHDDDLILIRQKERSNTTHVKKMRKLFEAADVDGNGQLDKHEFKRVLQHRDVRTWLTAMDYDIADIDVFFDMLDKNGSELISPEEFVSGITSLRGAAKSVDLKRLLHRFGDTPDPS